MPCQLCKEYESNKTTIYSTKYSFCIVAKWPLKPGHVLVLPKRHVKKLSSLSKNEAKDLLDEVEKMSQVLKRIYKEDCIIHLNRGRLGSQHHIHVHIVTSKEGLRPLISHLEKIPQRKHISLEEMEKIRDYIKNKIT